MPWCLVAIATATEDAFARELVSLELRFHSTLASVLQPARSPRRMRTQEYFANVREPLGFFQLSRVVTQARHRGGHRENIFFQCKEAPHGQERVAFGSASTCSSNRETDDLSKHAPLSSQVLQTADEKK